MHRTLIRRLTPTFAAEVGRRKLEQWHGLDGDRPPLWIAWSLAAWRLYYTEADRELLCAVFDDPLTKQGLERLRTSCRKFFFRCSRVSSKTRSMLPPWLSVFPFGAEHFVGNTNELVRVAIQIDPPKAIGRPRCLSTHRHLFQPRTSQHWPPFGV